MNDPNIMGKSLRRAGGVRQLAAVALLGLTLWLGLAASASAQSIPTTSPCPAGGASVPPGWTPIMSPDCSTVTNWNSSSGASFPWMMGNVPPTPDGHTTFMSLAGSEFGGEGMSTTITGLQAGRAYNVPIFFNGNVAALGQVSCPGTVTINGVVTPYPAASGNTWTQRLFPFVATGPTATLGILVVDTAGLCISNLYIAGQSEEVDVQVVKAVSPTGAVASGSVLNYTLTARNNGPTNATNVLLRDQPGAGLNCTAPSTTATCSASGGASCPGATVPVSSLTGGGVTLPNLPVGGQVVVTMRCTVTATGQ